MASNPTTLEQRQFTNMVRSLFNIDAYLLPELTEQQQIDFISDPVRYFIGSDRDQSAAIFREVLKRQPAEEMSAERMALEACVGALQFILAFYEPGQRALDTDAWKVACAGGVAAYLNGASAIGWNPIPMHADNGSVYRDARAKGGAA